MDLVLVTSPFAREAITVDHTVKSLTAATYNCSAEVDTTKMGKAKVALLTTETADIRVTFDGTDPVATTTGHLLTPGSSLTVENYETITKIKATREGSTNGSIQVTYWR